MQAEFGHRVQHKDELRGTTGERRTEPVQYGTARVGNTMDASRKQTVKQALLKSGHARLRTHFCDKQPGPDSGRLSIGQLPFGWTAHLSLRPSVLYY
jgi:hypothetical protein